MSLHLAKVRQARPQITNSSSVSHFRIDGIDPKGRALPKVLQNSRAESENWATAGFALGI
jgi:hypothetical protein